MAGTEWIEDNRNLWTEWANKVLTHNEAVEKLLIECKAANKKHFTDLFLSGMSGPITNSGLYFLAENKHFFSHPHVYTGPEPEMRYRDLASCEICSSYRLKKYSEGVFAYELIFEVGSPAADIYEQLRVISICNRIENVPAIKASDFAVMKEIILYLKNAEPNEKIQSIISKLKDAPFYAALGDSIKTYNRSGKCMVKDTVRLRVGRFMDVLGRCGILHAEEHKGPFYGYIDRSMEQASIDKTGWRDPVGYWRDKDGIDWEAFDYWFGEYEELKDVRG